MPRKIIDPETGALLFELTEEEKEIQDLKDRVKKLEDIISKINRESIKKSK